MATPKTKVSHAQAWRVSLNGEDYYTIKHFAELTNRTVPSVWALLSVGNRVRKLKLIRFAGKPMIPASELTEFPFTFAGRSLLEDAVYHYDENGRVKLKEEKEPASEPQV